MIFLALYKSPVCVCISGLSKLNQPQAANCQFSFLTGHKSVANHTSLPLPQWREEEGKNYELSKIESKCYDLEFFKHFISHIQQFNTGPIPFWFLSGPHEIASWAAVWKALTYMIHIKGVRTNSPHLQTRPKYTNLPHRKVASIQTCPKYKLAPLFVYGKYS